MNTEKTMEFIALVQEYPSLWKKQDKNFMNRDIKKMHFKEIAEKINLTEEECKRKLKSLKHHMRDVCSNLPKTSSGQPAFDRGEEIVRWQYFKPLLFMKDQFVGRKMCSSLQENAPENDNVSVASTEGDYDVDVDNDPPPSGIEDRTPAQKRTSSSTSMQPSTSKKAKTADQFLMLEREKLDSLKKIIGDSEKDEWRAYVDALVHDLRQVKNPYLKISMKNSISRIVGDTILQQLNIDQQQQCQQQKQQSYQQQQQLNNDPQQQQQPQNEVEAEHH